MTGELGYAAGAAGLVIAAWSFFQMRQAKDQSELKWRRDRDQLLASLAEREANVAAGLAELESQQRALAELTPEQARQIAIEQAMRDVHVEVTKREQLLEADSDDRARRTLLTVMERTHVPYVIESTTAIVALPSEDVKGRIIGREGRNIRSFEQITGVDLLIDDSPTTVAISSFDPVRREVARLTLINLIVDGRIHPGRIEELFAEASATMNEIMRDAGKDAANRAGVRGLPAKVLDAMGRLRFRAGMGQNVLDHSVEVAHLSALIAAELGFDEATARTAGFLHDIGKGLGTEFPGPHAQVGMEFLNSLQMDSAITHAVGAHHREIAPETPEAHIVIIADGLSAARPGARRDSLEGHTKRLAALETLAADLPGVERAFVVQGGREVRVIVRPEELGDAEARQLAKDLVKRIEKELDYPGQIMVTVIRETRATEVAQ